MNQLDREEDALLDAYERGDIDRREYNESMRELQREYRWMAQEAAQEAYDREMERW